MEFVLNALALSYRPLWNADRHLTGIQLFLHDVPDTVSDTAHLLRILQEMWTPSAPVLLLSPQSPALLQGLLAHATPSPFWAIEVRGSWLAADSGLLRLAQLASSHGVRLIWRGDLSQLPAAEQASYFACSLLHLAPQDAVALMRTPAGQATPTGVQLLNCQMYEDIHSQALMRRCLDQYQASAIAGWPVEDVLHHERGGRVLQPSHAHVLRLMKAVDADQPLDTFEEILSEDPLLAYRFMLYANSVAVGSRNPIDSLRRSLIMVGYEKLKQWLGSLLVQASEEIDLHPVRQSMVMRAQLTACLLDAGVSQELRSEVYLCGLFSRLDEILDEPLANSLARLPLSERIPDAALQHSGPYAPSLQLARTLECEDCGEAIRAVCAEHEIPLEFVNRSLLRLIAHWSSARPPWAGS